MTRDELAQEALRRFRPYTGEDEFLPDCLVMTRAVEETLRQHTKPIESPPNPLPGLLTANYLLSGLPIHVEEDEAAAISRANLLGIVFGMKVVLCVGPEEGGAGGSPSGW